MTSLGEAVVEIGADTTKFESEVQQGVESSLNKSSKAMQNVGKTMAGVGTKMTIGVTAPLLGIGAAALKTAANYETTMNVLQSATGASGSEMKALSAQAKQLGADTVFSAGEAGEAMLELGKAGQSTKQIMATVPQVMNLAATEGMALGDAAGVVTSVLAQFQLKADDAGQAVNALAGASTASKASVASIAEAMKLVGPAAAGMGFSVQETAGALAALAQGGLEGGIAGTSLASVFNKLIPQTTKAKNTMEALGLSFTNADGSFNSIAEVAGKLQDKFKGMAPAARKVALSKIFGNDASVLSAVNALINQGADGLKKYTKASNDQSAAQKLADARMKGTAGAIEKMKGSIETAMLGLGQALAPTITSIANVVGALADKFSSLSPTVQKVVVVIAAIAAAIGPVLVVVGTLISSIGAIAGVLGAVSLPVVAVVAAIGLLVGGFVLLATKSDAFRAKLVAAWDAVKAAVMPAIEEIGGMIRNDLIPGLQDIWTKVQPFLMPLLEWFGGAFVTTVVMSIKGVVKVITGIVKIITGVVQIISGVLTGDWGKVWDGAKNVVGGFFSALGGMIMLFISNLARMFPPLLAVVPIFQRVFGVIKSVVMAVVPFIVGVVRTQFNIIKAVITAVMRVVVPVVRTAFNIIRTVITTAVKILAPIVRAGFTVIRTVIRVVMKVITTVVRTQWRVISTVVRAAVNVVRKVVTTVFNAIRNVVSKVMNAVKKVISSAWGAIRGIVSKAANGVRSAVSGPFNALKGIVSKAWNAVKNAVSNAIGNIVKTVKGMGGKITGAISGINLFSAGAKLIQGLVDGIGSKINSAVQKVKDGLGKIKGLLPGSPIKWGPLKGWNGGKPGKALMALLARGVKNGSPKLVGQFTRTLGKVNKALGKTRLSDKMKKSIDKALDVVGPIAKQGNSIVGALGKTGAGLESAFTKQLFGFLRKGNFGKNAVKAFRKRMSSLSKEIAKVAKTLGEKTDLRNTFRDAFMGEFSLDAVDTSSIGAITGAASAIASRLKTFAGKLTDLGKAGIPPALISEVGNLGSEKGLPVADALLTSSKSERDALRAAYADIEKFSKQSANAGATSVFGTTEQISNPIRKKLGKKQVAKTTDTYGDKRSAPGVSTPAGDTYVTNNVEQNYYGPSTGSGRLKELDWTLKYATRAGGPKKPGSEVMSK